MFRKQEFVIALFSLLMLLRMSMSSVVKAADTAASSWQFETIHYETVSATLEGSCQATETTTQLWLFALTVTQELLADLQSNATDTEIVEFKHGNDAVTIEIDNDGSILVGQTMHVAFVSASTGQVTPLGADYATGTFAEYSAIGPHVDGLTLEVAMNLADELDMDVGDILLVRVETEATLQAHGCDPNGQPPVLSVNITRGVDNASPLLYIEDATH